MRASLPTLRLLLGSLTFLFLVACTSDDNNESQSDDINTFNFFVNDNFVYSFNSESGEFASLITNFDISADQDNQRVFLDTDEDKQGYEYLAYVDNSAIYLLDYNRENNGNITRIKTVTGTICGISPQLIASEAAFNAELTGRNNTHASSITIATANGASCNSASNFLDSLDFSELIDDDTLTNEAKLTSLSSALFYGDNIISFSSSPTLNTSTQRTVGISGFLGYDLEAEQIQFSYTNTDEIDRSWRSQKNNDTPFIPTLVQSSKSHAIIQIDENLFVIRIDTLFNINENKDSPSSTQASIDALFETATKTFDSSTPIKINNTMAADSFLLKSDDQIYIYQDSALTEFPNLGLADAIEFDDNEDFDLISPNTLIFVKEVNGKQLLSYSKPSMAGPSGFISADEVDFRIVDNELFVSTLNSQTNSGWEAHWFKDETQLADSETSTTYSNSHFIFADDTRQEEPTLLLLSSDTATNSSLLPSRLYKFDKTEANGRLRVSENNQDVEFNYGQFGRVIDDIVEDEFVINDIIKAEIINDIYGKLKLKGSRNNALLADEHFFFNPSQTSLEPEDATLKLILVP